VTASVFFGESVRIGGRPVAHREIVRFGLGADAPSAWPGDLLAYRQEWEPFIAGHLAQWRYVNQMLEGIAAAQQCPAGIFTATQIQNLDPTTRSYCAALSLSRQYTSATDPSGILPQWNAWAGKSAAEVLAAAGTMLKWHQDVVMRVGGSYKDQLVQIAQDFKLDVELPEVPTLSEQQDIIARINGAYVSAKGVLQLIGYGAGGVLTMASDTAQAVAKGLQDTAKKLPTVLPTALIWVGVAAVVVGGALVIYYHPRKAASPLAPATV
jgi:hypothetical protein